MRTDLSSLTIIIPVRGQSPEFYLTRLQLRDGCDLTGTQTILVDDGSPTGAAEEIRAFCENRGWRYLRLETEHAAFSLARARNAGLAAAETPWVFFDDADMVYESTFFRKLCGELELIKQTPFSFLSLPAVYLSEQKSSEVLAKGGVDEMQPLILTQLLLEDPRGSSDNRTVESFAPASAILAMTKETALSAGGYDEGFHGWGGEDRDFIFRLLALNEKLPKPVDFAATRVWNLNDTHEFAGWRSLYRLHGDYMARKAFYAFHLYHESNSWRTAKKHAQNFERAARKAQKFAELHASSHDEFHTHNALRRSLLFSTYAGCAPSTPTNMKKVGSRNRMARLRKFCRNPHAFFQDSKFAYLRKLRHLFAEKENEL